MKPIVEGPWVACLPASAAGALDALRLDPGLETLDEAGQCWVRSRALVLPMQVPWERVFAWGPQDDLIAPGHYLPERKLPVGKWSSLQSRRAVEPVAPGLPAREVHRVTLSLVVGDNYHEPDLLETTGENWSRWAETAPAVRLGRLKFAVVRSGSVFVTGMPLPPIPGRRFSGHQLVYAPAGMRFQVGVSSETIRAVLGLEAKDVAVFESTGVWRRIPHDVWLPASRALIRMSREQEAVDL